jgi:cytochrome oxidase Cu insertion factor (SCO1/SenC/PrrC family)
VVSVLAFALAALVLPAAGQKNYPLAKPQVASAEGKPAPTFSLPDQNSKAFHLSSLRGRRVLLIFYRGYW